MKTTELIEMLQQKVERYGDQEVVANSHKIVGVVSGKNSCDKVSRFNIVFETYVHEPYK